MMFRCIGMAIVLSCALAASSAAAEKKFSWDDESIMSSDPASKHGWGDESFDIAGEQPVPDAQDNTDQNAGAESGGTVLSTGGLDEPATDPSEKKNGGDSGFSWGDGIDEPLKDPGDHRAGTSGRSWSGSDEPQKGAPAAQPGKNLVMLVIDRDKAGTNVRSAPSGKISAVIPLGDAAEVRPVALSGSFSKGWFELAPGGLAEKGWVHRSVLGICAGAAAKGGADAYVEPSLNGPSLKIPAGIPLTPIEMRGEWVLLRLGMGTSDAECWIQKDDLILDGEGLADCASTWADR